jgi:hypothetical protein
MMRSGSLNLSIEKLSSQASDIEQGELSITTDLLDVAITAAFPMMVSTNGRRRQ